MAVMGTENWGKTRAQELLLPQDSSVVWIVHSKVGSDGLVPHTKGGETAFLLPPEARIRLYFAFQQGIKMSKILGHEWM